MCELTQKSEMALLESSRVQVLWEIAFLKLWKTRKKKWIIPILNKVNGLSICSYTKNKLRSWYFLQYFYSKAPLMKINCGHLLLFHQYGLILTRFYKIRTEKPVRQHLLKSESIFNFSRCFHHHFIKTFVLFFRSLNRYRK